MKQYLLLSIFLFGLNFVAAQVFDKETIKYSGTDDKRINIVILGDGYQASELDQFITDATSFTTDMFGQSPFSEYSNYFNVYAIKVPSNESGADHPGTGNPTDEATWPVPNSNVDTYFNSTFDAFGNHFLLYYEIDGNSANNTVAKINDVLADNFPTYDEALILVNSDFYGGSGLEFPVASTGISGNNIAIHEMGHTLFDLKDEYYPGDALAAEAINMTQETDANLIKWKNWLNINGVGIFQHSDFNGNPKDWYKPRNDKCKMERITEDFCSVCQEGIIEKIHDLVSPIESFVPNNTTVSNPTLPLDVQLNLIKPIPNTLKSEWTLNGSNFANDVDAVSLESTDLIEGENTLTTVVHDDSPLLKIDNHDTSSHVYTVTWTINYSSLGIENIQSETADYKISLYPNPASDILNLNVESTNAVDLNVDILSLDGKKIKAFSISNSSNQTVNIDELSQGVYLVNFYANNVLIDSKKLVKL